MTPLTFTPPFPIGKYNYKQESNFLCQRCKTSYKNRQGKMSHYLTAKHATYCQPPKSFDEFLHKPAAILRKQQNYTISNALHNQWIFNISSFWQSNQLGRLSNNHQQCLSTLLNDFHLYCISNFFFFWIFFFFFGQGGGDKSNRAGKNEVLSTQNYKQKNNYVISIPKVVSGKSS